MGMLSTLAIETLNADNTASASLQQEQQQYITNEEYHEENRDWVLSTCMEAHIRKYFIPHINDVEVTGFPLRGDKTTLSWEAEGVYGNNCGDGVIVNIQGWKFLSVNKGLPLDWEYIKTKMIQH
eukprot:5883007-Ditylum_brightwellii.AAC.1